MIPVRNSIVVTPIGTIRSPYQTREDAPRQGRFSDALITLEILPEFTEGLQDVEQQPHLIVLYWLDRSNRTALRRSLHTQVSNMEYLPPALPLARIRLESVLSTSSAVRGTSCSFEVLMRSMEHHYLISSPIQQFSIL